MKLRTAVGVGVVAALLFMSLAVYFSASYSILGNPGDFAPSSTAWNGFSQFVSVEKPVLLQNLSSLPPGGSGFVLLENGPSRPYSSAEAARVSAFVTSGGTLILADGVGEGNTLLSGMGLSSRFTGGVLVDPLFNFRNSFLVVAPTVSMHNVTSVAFDYATTLTVTDRGARVLARSSSFSYLYPTQPGESIADAPHGPFPVVAEIPYGKGTVYLIADESVFINSMIHQDGNSNMLKDLSTGQMLLDMSHFSVGPATTVRSFEASLYAALFVPEIRYSIVIAGVAGILAYRFGQKQPAEEEELKAVLREHPEWSEETLRRLSEEMEGR